MKLAVILPGNYEQELCEHRETYLNEFVSSGTKIKVFKTGGTQSITSIVDLALISSGALNKTLEAEKSGFEGVLLH
jgi:hypothetical protein